MTTAHPPPLGAAARTATVARGAGVSFVGHLAGRGFGFLLTVVLTRALGAGDFGLFVLALSIFQVSTLFADLGLRDGALRFVALAEGRGDRAERARVIGTVLRWSAATSIVAALVLAALAPLVAQWFRQPALRWMIPLFAIGLPFWAAGVVLRNVLQALKRLEAIAVLQNVVDPVTKLLVFVGCAALGWGVAAAVTAHVAAAGLVLAGALAWLRRWWPAATDRARGETARALLAFSIPLSLTHLAGLAVQTTDSLFLGYFTSARDLGVYGAAGRVAALGGMTLLAGSLAFAPHANELFGRGDRAGIARLYQQVTRWLITLSLPVFALMVTFAEPVLGLFGPEFREGSLLLVVLAAGVFVNVATGPAGDVVLVAGRSRIVLVVGTLNAVLNVALQWTLVPRWGVTGAALATAATVALSNVGNVGLGWWLLRLQPYGAALARPLALGGAAGVLTAVIWALIGVDSLPGALGVVAIWIVGYPLLVLRVALADDDRAALRALLRSGARAPGWSEAG